MLFYFYLRWIKQNWARRCTFIVIGIRTATSPCQISLRKNIWRIEKKTNLRKRLVISPMESDETLLIPISWFLEFEFCEYQIYLQYIKGVEPEVNAKMIQGKEIHEDLYQKFCENAETSTFQDILQKSRSNELISREFSVTSNKHRIMGIIDEILFTPDNYVIIDDKPGKIAYPSNKSQILGYCLAFKDYLNENSDGEFNKPIYAALRERGTDNIIWKSLFDKKSEDAIITKINHLHALIDGNADFRQCNNPNKCRTCKVRISCTKDH